MPGEGEVEGGVQVHRAAGVALAVVEAGANAGGRGGNAAGLGAGPRPRAKGLLPAQHKPQHAQQSATPHEAA